MQNNSFLQKHQLKIEPLFILFLAATVRLSSLNVFRAVDEADRWAWAVDFYQALLAGDLPGTLVGDGYPGVFPVWLETIWLFLASLYRSGRQGSWIGDDGVYLLIHEWDRTAYLGMQRLPVVLANTILVILIFLYLRRLFGRDVALLSAILISLDPFYLSDSRVNRAEGLLTGLMMVSLLALIAAHRESGWRHLIVSAVFGGLAWLTKSQALVLLPMFGLISLIWHGRFTPRWTVMLRRWGLTMAGWFAIACATFILLWPAAWTVPGDTFSLMLNYLTRKVGEEGVKIFFLGQLVLDEDPGLLFYPVIFILRTTPLMLFGLLLGLWLLAHQKRNYAPSYWRSWLDKEGGWALLAYVLLYVGGMSLGSHKQDRFLMAAFPALNVLAALAFVHLARQRRWSTRQVWLAGGLVLVIQLATALPFHPYYFSYFNPLAGGGRVAARLTRIGWGEGMDQVADYLQSQDDPESLVVASRFFHYLLDFKGTRINLSSDGDWVRADKIIFYIQQTQRMLDPSPGVIRYFERHIRPEKIVTINQIDYAKIYPNPIQFPADPLIDQIEGELSLFGYRWEAASNSAPTIRFIWQNLNDTSRPIGIRLWTTDTLHSDWQTCQINPAFTVAARTSGEVVESDCRLSATNLPPGLYDLQIGLQSDDAAWQPLDFASGWSAVELTSAGEIIRIEPERVFAHLAAESLPDTATRLEHIYAGRIRLLAFELGPEQVRPGHPFSLTLYWQATRVLDQDAHVSVQAFLSNNEQVALLNGPPRKGQRPTGSWRPGEVIADEWTLELPPDIPTPALLRLDVGLFLPETLVTLPSQNPAGENIPAAITTIRLEPDTWPGYRGDHPLDFTFAKSINLIGYETRINPADNALEVTLYWQARAPLSNGQPQTAFLHLVNSVGALVAQSDIAPAHGLFPTTAWQPGDVVLSWHRLAIPPDTPADSYTLLTGLYRPSDGLRLPVRGANDEPLPNSAAPIGSITWQ